LQVRAVDAVILRVKHPLPSRLLAFARHRIDFDKEVEEHVERCPECAKFVDDALSEAEKKPAAGAGHGKSR
jgi:hypothetical protein